MQGDIKDAVLDDREVKKVITILEILSSLEPAAMNFSNFFTIEELHKDIDGGITAWMLERDLIRPVSSDKTSFSITARGFEFLKSPRTIGGSITEKSEMNMDEVMFSIRPSSWPHKLEALWTPMIHDFGKLKNDLPFITFGIDCTDKFENLPLTPRNKEIIPYLSGAAQKNLQNIEVELIHEKGSDLAIVYGHYFASEKILDTAFMLEFHKVLDSEYLVASIPKKGRLFITKSFDDVEKMEAFKEITRMEYEKPSEDYSITKTLFLISEGNIRGIVQPEFKLS